MRLLATFKHLLVVTLIGFSSTIFAQNAPVNKKNYALLWEISGNGLTKPSYLFGTMHLRNKRVFEFSDSVLLKLEACDVFASEVRMDSAVYQSWEATVSGDTTNNLNRKLSKQGYARLLKALKSKGINLDSLTNKNAAAIHGKFTNRDEENSEDEKDLFLDLYLTRLAYNQGKTLHGLENLADYEDLNDSFLKQFEDSTFFQKDTSFLSILSHITLLDRMIEVYNQGDLESLQRIIRDEKSFNGNQYKREILDNRNLKMVQKLDDLMRQKSVFCAVGAAHLPDSVGLIALLREKGYTVRKVTPQFTGLAEQFKPKTVKHGQFHLKDDFNHLELDFPEEPYLVNKMRGSRKSLGAQYVYFDITTGAIHFAEIDFHLVDKQAKLPKEKEVELAFSQWLSYRKLKNIKKEKMTMGDNEGIRFTAILPSKALVKGQFLIANNSIYKTIVFFDQHKSDDTERADAFLNSLKINPLPLTDWQVFEEGKAAFSLKMPVKPEFQTIKTNIAEQGEPPLNYYTNLFVSKELETGFTYMVRYSDMPEGRHIDNDSTYLSKIVLEAQSRFKKFNAKIEIDSLTRHYGCPEYNIKISIEGISLFMRNILRGNRLYVLLSQPPLEKNKANNKKSEDWLNSFRFLPFNAPKLTEAAFPELGLKMGMPTAVEPSRLVEETGDFPTQKVKVIRTTDNQTGGVWMVSKTIFSDYYNAINTDSFWHKYTRTIEMADNAYVKVTIADTLFRDLKAKYVTLDYLQSQNTYKAIVLLKDGFQYEFSLILPYEIASDAYASNYFNTVAFTENKDKKNIFIDRKKLIINDLASPTDSIFQNAKVAFKETEWAKNDAPILLEALQKKYPDDSLEYNGLRVSMLNQLTDFKDVATLDVLEKLVRSTEKDTFIRDAALCAFLELDTLNSANRFFDIVKSLNQVDLSNFYCLNRFMTDSIERAKTYYDKLLLLSKEPFQNRDLVRISASLAKADTLRLMADVFKKYTPQYLDAANDCMRKNSDFLQRDTIAEADNDGYTLLYNYVELFKNTQNTSEINQFLNKIATTRQTDLLSRCIQALVKNKQPITTNQWQTIFKDRLNWFYLLSNLESDSLLSAVPPQYLGQKDIVEGAILNYLSEDYGTPKAFNFVETQKYKGELVYVYKCKMDYGEDEKNNALIVLCAQPMDKTKFNLSPQLLMVSEALEDVKGYKKIVVELLKDYEKNAALIDDEIKNKK
jgi:uncharacterized protein YbaP (TraB family)